MLNESHCINVQSYPCQCSKRLVNKNKNGGGGENTHQQ